MKMKKIFGKILINYFNFKLRQKKNSISINNLYIYIFKKSIDKGRINIYIYINTNLYKTILIV